ncbi:orc1/cdc6 family replication initiation protein [Infirmifilum lucidum]|uniref:Orc1/cdc6 family replication initiation protein n=1 Tax=Infirmifilum lucidum TaxID=2776706 RepID=A0A7L9FGE4_9CREN|nr:orc1/cdc6 family replication initiation protein [Infirmifilum lucidum]QOJ78888.1 orc1/cdc6 family replication initiation protein [Infirmifilum lucidum]
MRNCIPKLGLILISTSGNDLLKLVGKRLFYTLRIEALLFEPYSINELVEIMKSRLKEAFGKNIADELALFEIASFVKSTSQNVRHAFSIIQDAIEVSDENKVTVEVVRKAIEKQMKLAR